MTMWAITSYYNPRRYRRRSANYRIFRANLRVPLVAVELSFDGRFELTSDDADVLVQISGRSVMWQKERLLNVALRHIPEGVPYVAWLDCDVILGHEDWAAAAAAQLRSCQVVQLFSRLVDLRHDDVGPSVSGDGDTGGTSIVCLLNTGRSTAADFGPHTTRDVRRSAFGLAWAARRELLDAHGFYDAMIVGSGDRAMVCAMYRRFDELARWLELNEPRRSHYLRWARGYHESVGRRVGYVEGSLYHLWHGDLNNREYRRRHQEMARFDFDPALDLRISEAGAWEWARPQPQLARFLEDYFTRRNEDGTGVAALS
jgi:hypothetical protein